MAALIMQSLVYYATTSIARHMDSSIALVPTTLCNSHNNFYHAT